MLDRIATVETAVAGDAAADERARQEEQKAKRKSEDVEMKQTAERAVDERPTFEDQPEPAQKQINTLPSAYDNFNPFAS